MEKTPPQTKFENHNLNWGRVSNVSVAAKLVRSSWLENKQASPDYDGEFLRSCLEYPGAGPILAPALYHENNIVAFVIGIPRRVLLNGQEQNLVLLTLFTVAPEWKGKGLGRAVWAECLRQARENGYDGAIHYCVEGNISNRATAAGAHDVGLEATPVLIVKYLMKLLDDMPPSDELLHQCSCKDFSAAAQRVLPVSLARIWTPAEIQWQREGRVDPICVTHRAGKAFGILAGYRIQSLGVTKTSSVLVDDILWHELHGAERVNLVRVFLGRAAHNAQVVVVPLLGYADMSPFFEAGFRRSTRVVHAYLTMWKGLAEPIVGGMYMDVL